MIDYELRLASAAPISKPAPTARLAISKGRCWAWYAMKLCARSTWARPTLAVIAVRSRARRAPSRATTPARSRRSPSQLLALRSRVGPWKGTSAS